MKYQISALYNARRLSSSWSVAYLFGLFGLSRFRYVSRDHPFAGHDHLEGGLVSRFHCPHLYMLFSGCKCGSSGSLSVLVSIRCDHSCNMISPIKLPSSTRSLFEFRRVCNIWNYTAASYCAVVLLYQSWHSRRIQASASTATATTLVTRTIQVVSR